MTATQQNIYAVQFEGARNADYYVADGLIDLANQICNACEDSSTRRLGDFLRIERLGSLAHPLPFKEVARD